MKALSISILCLLGSAAHAQGLDLRTGSGSVVGPNVVRRQHRGDSVPPDAGRRCGLYPRGRLLDVPLSPGQERYRRRERHSGGALPGVVDDAHGSTKDTKFFSVSSVPL